MVVVVRVAGLAVHLSAQQVLRRVNKWICQLGLEGGLPAKGVAREHLHSQCPLYNSQQGG